MENFCIITRCRINKNTAIYIYVCVCRQVRKGESELLQRSVYVVSTNIYFSKSNANSSVLVHTVSQKYVAFLYNFFVSLTSSFDHFRYK